MQERAKAKANTGVLRVAQNDNTIEIWVTTTFQAMRHFNHPMFQPSNNSMG
jgi:hypothetical protein